MEKIPGIRYLITIAVLLTLWSAASVLVGNTLLPGPIPTTIRLGQEIRQPVFWSHIHASFYRVMGGLACGFITAVPLGLMMGSSRTLDRWFSPLIYLTYPIPKIVFLPVFLLLFGLGDMSKILLIALIIFFQLLITTRDSARQIETEMIYSFQSLGGNRWHYFRHVVWPVSLPGIFTSLRVGTGIAVAVLFFVESIGTRRGLGFFIIDSWGIADYPAMFVGIISLSAIGIVLYEAFDLLEKRVCRWKQI
ncbi:MAG: ABC transporter permease [Desulfobacterales bacterium]|nr:ABC transporter permease [Desulfobacterales bacterium]MDD4073575.1 ABC transporter permease [Desulfobacterales bacterium]MDD4393138.1 ABC transporter permease [Desulfobacterales bacterium]